MKKYFLFVVFVLLVIVFWNLVDWIYETVITGSGYQYSTGNNLGFPLILGTVMGYLLVLRGKD